MADNYPHTTVRGFEIDDATREVIADAGLGEWFIHRTGHSIGIQDHGQGANMDNLETIGPGIYLRESSGCGPRSTSRSPVKPPRSPAPSRRASCCGFWRSPISDSVDRGADR